MEPFITTIVAAFVAGATAKLKDVSSQAVSDCYQGLRSILTRRLGKTGAIQSVENNPASDNARATLTEELAHKLVQGDAELEQLAKKLEEAITAAKAAGVPGAADIEIETVHGRINAIVENLAAAGRIRLGSVVADSGDARVSGLRAGALGKN